MSNETKNQSRRKFIGWGLASAAVLSAVKFFKPAEKKATPETVKMLTQDGRLVEVDISSIPSKRKKVTNAELQNWVKK